MSIRGLVRRLFLYARDSIRGLQYSEYKVPLLDLIQRAEVRFERVTKGVIEFRRPVCPYCDRRMMFRHSEIVVGRGPVRDDQVWKCTRCYHTAHFGLPITRGEALEEIDLRGGPTLMRPSRRSDEDGLEVVTERLRRLGYIE